MKVEKLDIKNKYEVALEAFVKKIEEDSNIIAAFTYGSIVSGNLWEKSDIDIWLISKENSKKIYNQYSLIVDSIDFQVELYSRNHFFELVDSPQGQSFFRTVLLQSKLIYSKDQAIENLFNEEHNLGNRDKEESLLKAAIYGVICVKKIEKFLKLNENILLAFSIMLRLVKNLANIEVAYNNQYPCREVENQALNLNYDFFNDIYVDLINSKVDMLSIENKLSKCKKYLDDKNDVVFEPIIKWLSTEGEIRRVSEINEYIKRKYNISNDGNELTDTYNWLVERRILIKTSESLKLLDKSKVYFEEAAYSYDFTNM